MGMALALLSCLCYLIKNTNFFCQTRCVQAAGATKGLEDSKRTVPVSFGTDQKLT